MKIITNICLTILLLSHSLSLAAEKDNILLLITPVLSVPKNQSQQIDKVIIYCDKSGSPCPAGFLSPGTLVEAWAQGFTSKGERAVCNGKWVWSIINPACCTVINEPGDPHNNVGEETNQRFNFTIGPDAGAAQVTAFCNDKPGVVGRLLVSGSGGVSYVSSLYTASTTVTYHGLCKWRHDISGNGTATVTGDGPYDVTFSFSGTDVITPIEPSQPQCEGGTESGSGTKQVTIGVDKIIDVTMPFGDGTGRFVGEISADMSKIVGTLTINNPEFDAPAVGPLVLTKQ